jgi:hypothetical protein
MCIRGRSEFELAADVAAGAGFICQLRLSGTTNYAGFIKGCEHIVYVFVCRVSVLRGQYRLSLPVGNTANRK